ncbi:MAG: SLAP domain-containing protein [Lactobacillus sp.]|nr:SLAP domain-containing protein [Lactobacillus sp.]
MENRLRKNILWSVLAAVLLAVGATFTGNTAQAATNYPTEDVSGTVTVTNPDGAPLYFDQGTFTPLNRSLPAGSQWKAIYRTKTADGSYTYNLGGTQWVKAKDISYVDGTTLTDGVLFLYRGINTSTGATLPAGTFWKVFNVYGGSNANTFKYDVGGATVEGTPNTDFAVFGSQEGNFNGTFTVYGSGPATLYDGAGNGVSQLYAGSAWKVFGAKVLNGAIYLRVGNDTQWVRLDAGNISL